MVKRLSLPPFSALFLMEGFYLSPLIRDLKGDKRRLKHGKVAAIFFLPGLKTEFYGLKKAL